MANGGGVKIGVKQRGKIWGEENSGFDRLSRKGRAPRPWLMSDLGGHNPINFKIGFTTRQHKVKRGSDLCWAGAAHPGFLR